MGHPTSVFSPEPSQSTICAICADVLQDACSVKECGHTFCYNCIETSLESSNTCPNCRIEVSGYTPNYFARDTVDELQVLCLRKSKDGAPSDDNDDGSNKKRKRDNDTNCCNWKGPLKDLKRHEDTECGYKTVTCSIVGCEHTCLRKDMESHLSGGAGLITHMTLMQKDHDEKMKQMEQKCDTKIAKVQSECEEKIKRLERQTFVKSRYIHDCRNWIENKPDALSDFSVYSVGVGGCSLLCYIPGPAGSAWEGARIPMSLIYDNTGRGIDKPPKCRFAAGFFHMNVYPSGTICVSTINEEEGWTPEMTLPEILFTIQQLLCHPNPNSPAQITAYNVFCNEGADKYHRRTKEEADKYANYTGHHADVAKLASNVDDMEIGKKVELVSRRCREERVHPVDPRTQATIFQKDSNGNCECSCCALGQNFWDSEKKMRFLFGVGG